MSCLIKIRSIRDDMSANEKKLADYIISNAALLRDYSSLQLATAVSVSQSSVVKFCQKLGYKGYPDLKLAINEAVAKSSTESNGRAKYFSDSKLNSVSEQLLKSKLEAVTATIELNTEKSFLTATNAIAGANKTQVIGSGIASFTADYFATQLIFIGKAANATNDLIYQKQFMKSLAANDVLILLSAMDELAIDNLNLSELRNKEVQVIQICPYSPNNNYHQSDIALSTISNHDHFPNEFSQSRRAAQQHIIDILLSMLHKSESKDSK